MTHTATHAHWSAEKMDMSKERPKQEIKNQSADRTKSQREGDSSELGVQRGDGGEKEG